MSNAQRGTRVMYEGDNIKMCEQLITADGSATNETIYVPAARNILNVVFSNAPAATGSANKSPKWTASGATITVYSPTASKTLKATIFFE